MKRLMMLCVTATLLAACGSAAANDREVASLSTAAAGNATADTADATGDSTGDSTGATVPIDPSEAPLQFAKCMREHGIDMPDPTVGEGGQVAVQIGGGAGEGPDAKEVDAANKDCQHFLESAGSGFEPPSPEDQKKMQDQALAFSKCMRDHGIDMPDPQFSTDGGGAFSIAVGAVSEAGSPTNDGPLIDFNSKEFKAASEACGGPGGGGLAISTGTLGG